MRALLFGLILLPFLAGCGGSKVAVSGRVLFNGKPLPGGLVTFRPADPKYNPVNAEVDEQGNYQAMLPVGEVQVAVDNRQLQSRRTGSIAKPPEMKPEVQKELDKHKSATPPPSANNPNQPGKPHGTYVPIPEKFYSLENSGLTFTVERGNPTHDIDLK